MGAIGAQLDPNTEFGLRARCRLTARKSFVKLDCSTRVQAALLRKAVSIPKEYQMGDMVMLRKEQGAVEPQDIWRGPARIIGFENNTTWLSFEAGVIASALHLLRPPTAAELLAWIVLNRLDSKVK